MGMSTPIAAPRRIAKMSIALGFSTSVANIIPSRGVLL
jgi:hypothetical protein